MESAEKTDSLNCCSGFRADPDNIKEDRKESAICFFSSFIPDTKNVIAK
jgi:hypothetical protein